MPALAERLISNVCKQMPAQNKRKKCLFFFKCNVCQMEAVQSSEAQPCNKKIVSADITESCPRD